MTLTMARYEELMTAEAKLTALESAGVDNWDGYDEAMRLFYSDEDETEEDIYGEE